MEEARARVTLEIELGYDMRARGAIAQSIVSGLHAGLRQNRWVSKRSAMDMADLAMRVVAMDAATGVALHYQVKAREAKARAHELGEAISLFGKTIHDVRGATKSAATSLRDTAEELAELARDGAVRTEIATRAATNTASNVATMAAATQELFASVNNIRQQAGASARMAYDAVSQTRQTNATIVSLSEAVDKIGSVIGLISDIATSTNMLALNATIEAGRAGEAGRGFAVVAAEVKSLAKQTSQATEEIGTQIAMIQDAARCCVAEINMSTQAITGIASIVEAVAASVDQQANATGGISTGVQGAADNATTLAEALRIIENTVNRNAERGADGPRIFGTFRRRLAKRGLCHGCPVRGCFEAQGHDEDIEHVQSGGLKPRDLASASAVRASGFAGSGEKAFCRLADGRQPTSRA